MLNPNGAPSYATRQIHVPFDFKRVRPRAGRDPRRADLRGFRAVPAVRCGFPAQRDAGEHPQQPRWGMDLDALDELFAVLTGEVQRERAELPRLRRDRPRHEPRAQTAAATRATLSRRRTTTASHPACPRTNNPSGVIPGALHGVKSAVVTAGPQTAGLSSGARGPPFKSIFSSLNGVCGIFQELRRQLPRRGVRLDITVRP